MNKGIIGILSGILLTFYCCKSPKVNYNKNDCTSFSQDKEDIFLAKYGAEQDSASLIIFIGAYDNTKVSVTNQNEIIFNDIIQGNRSSGVSLIQKINNNSDVIIKDIEKEYSFILHSKNLKKYKYVYIKRDMFKTSRQYEIEYSNTLCGFR